MIQVIWNGDTTNELVRAKCLQVFQAERRIHQHLSIKQIDSSCGIEYQNNFVIGIGIDIDILILRYKTLGIGLDWKQKSRIVLVLILKWITNQDKSWYWSQLKLDIKTCLGIGIERNQKSRQVLVLVSNQMEGLAELWSLFNVADYFR